YQSLNQNSFGRRSVQRKRTKQPFNDCLILFIYSLSTGFDKEPAKQKGQAYGKLVLFNSRHMHKHMWTCKLFTSVCPTSALPVLAA
ncbi:hypothetical protein, partial [Lactobacillus helveticus]|uniref:hypothetical protein n=1 Tax=Lactobacillus helveticus TaxID=1587 RepID=UPI001C647787